MADLHEQRPEHLAPRHIAAHGERAERVAVVALAPRDEAMARGPAGFHEVLARQLERGFVGLRSAGDIVDLGHAVRRAGNQVVGQGLRGFAGEERGVRVGQPVELVLDRLDHRRMVVPEAGHGGPGGGVQIALAVAVDDVEALAADRDRIGLLGVAVKDVAHVVGSVAVDPGQAFGGCVVVTLHSHHGRKDSHRNMGHRNMGHRAPRLTSRAKAPPRVSTALSRATPICTIAATAAAPGERVPP